MGHSWVSLQDLVSLDLSHNMLSTLNESFTNLTNLSTLNLAGNDFVEVPQEISGLFSLTSLDLTLNKIETLGDENHMLLATSLRTLKMRSNCLDNINGLVHCTLLEEAYLDSNRLKKIPEKLSCLQNLKILHLYINEIEAIPASFSKLDGLRDVDLSMNKLKNLPSSFTSLTRLITLFAQNNHISQLPDDIFENLPNLNCILLSNNDLKSLPTSLGTLTSLYRLELSLNRLKGNKFPDLRNVKLNHLDLGYNLLRTIPTPLFEQDNLVYLSLFNNKLKHVDNAITNLANLKKLNISYNQIPTLPETLSKLEHLIELIYDGNDLKEIPEAVCSLPKLKLLSVNNNRITELPLSISNLTTLTDFSCISNNIRSLEPLCLLKQMTELNVSHNGIVELPEGFQAMDRLVEFDISGNLLTAFTVVALPSLQHLKILFNKMAVKPDYQGHYCLVDTGNPYNGRKEKGKKKKSKLKSSQEGELKIVDEEVIEEVSSPRRRKRKSPNSNSPRGLKEYRNYIGWAETRGRRPDMQDSLVIERHIFDRDMDMFGLFDGHAGSRSADLCASILVEVIERNLGLEETLDNGGLRNCLSRSVVCLHHAIVRQKLDDGTAALIGLVVNTKSLKVSQETTDADQEHLPQPLLVLANSGDQRAVLCRDGKHINLTKDHKPDDAEELSRIKREGGFVSETKRVNGILALSRAVGDVDLQPFVTFDPQVVCINITPDAEFVIIACDGLWDVVSSEAAVNIVRHINDPVVAATKLKDYAYSLNSGDNISVIVYRFKNYDPQDEER